ncbi:MAG: HNH endonuclease [Cetobacterium sp.]
MYIVKRGEVLHIDVIKKGINESEIKISGKNVIEVVKNVNIHNTRHEAKLEKYEINIKKKFKAKMSNKKGTLTCCKCNTKGKHLTVDHIVPMSEFGGRREVRKDYNLWKDVWDESNLQILCEDCNRIKGSMPQETFDKFNMNKIYKRGMLLNNKKNELMSKKLNSFAHKAGFGVSSSRYSYDSELETSMLMHLAKMDSRKLYPELIFK